jgi:hypothetical protein
MMEARDVRRERIFVGIFLFAMCLTLAYFVQSAWSAGENAAVRSDQPVSGLYAPDAYRVAMPALADFLQRVHPGGRPFMSALCDFCFFFAALFLLYRLTVDDLTPPDVGLLERTTVVAIFLAFLQFPIAWVIPWQRPETAPTALYLAFALFCVSRRSRQGRWFGLLLAATALQSFVRADAPFVFGAALLLLSFGGDRLRPFGSRLSSVLKAGLVAVVAAGGQMYLQFIRFPHLTYPPGTAVVQLINNLHPHNLWPFGIAVLPFLLLAAFLIDRRPKLRSVDTLAVAAAGLYLPLWFTVGRSAEVRIFVPFMLALCMVAARVFGGDLAALCSATKGEHRSTPPGEIDAVERLRRGMMVRERKALTWSYCRACAPARALARQTWQVHGERKRVVRNRATRGTGAPRRPAVRDCGEDEGV